MASEILVQKDNGNKPAAPSGRLARDWDPFRGMRDLLRWDPFTDLAPAWSRFESAAFAPSFEVKETKDAFSFTADMPGVAEKDLQVQLVENRLNVSGKRESEKSEQGDTFYMTERTYGSFSRSFTLPSGIDADKVKAELKNGVLSITVPKRPEAQPKKINVSAK
jgi:HSP20 family protein